MITLAHARKLRELILRASISLTDEDALEGIELFPLWKVGVAYTALTDRVQYEGKLYRCEQSHTSQSDWTPDITIDLWTEISIDEFPEWRQPTGAQDAYGYGAKVSHNGKHWISVADANVWEPPTMWDEV